MLSALQIVFLAAVVTAVDITGREQTIRIGSVGSTLSRFRGILEPRKDLGTEGIPTYVLRGTTERDLSNRDDLLTFRCTILDETFALRTPSHESVLLCTNEISLRMGSHEKRKVFLFNAEDLRISSHVKEIDLMVTKTFIPKFVDTLTSHITGIRSDSDEEFCKVKTLSRMEGIYDGFKLHTRCLPYESLLEFRKTTGGVDSGKHGMFDDLKARAYKGFFD